MDILQDSVNIQMYIATYSSMVCVVIELPTKVKNYDHLVKSDFLYFFEESGVKHIETKSQ